MIIKPQRSVGGNVCTHRYIDSSMSASEASDYMRGLRGAGPAIFNRQAQLLESKASQKANQAAQCR